MPRGGAPTDPNAIRKKQRANASSGLQWWRKLSLPRRGKKASLLSPAPLPTAQQAKIKERVAALRKAVAAPRATRAKGMAMAEWDEESCTAHVSVTRGGSIQSMGEFVNGVQRLYAEEALYLVDRGVLDCCVEGLPMSVQRMWAVAVGGERGVTMEEYLVYAHLRRMGWVVRRVDKEVKGGGLSVSFAVWRVGGFKRRDQTRPQFYVAVYALGGTVEEMERVVRFCDTMDKCRLKIATVDRGIVVLMDFATNATPLSNRYLRRIEDPDARNQADRLRQGDIHGFITPRLDGDLSATNPTAKGATAQDTEAIE